MIPAGAALDPELLYQGDNGRITCGRWRCAGSTAHATGRDLSGHPVEPVGPAHVAEWRRELGRLPACEGCGQVHVEIAAITPA